MFEYIDENLKEMIKNPDNILCLKADSVGDKIALFAIIKEEDGIYKKLQITKEQSKLTFPFEPILCFQQGPGYLYLKDFISFNNVVALNLVNMDGFKYGFLDDDIHIYATFNDGSALFVRRKKQKDFIKQGGIESYIDLLRKYKEYDPQHDKYYSLEYYMGESNYIIIPELQEKTEKTNIEAEQVSVLKKTKNNRG